MYINKGEKKREFVVGNYSKANGEGNAREKIRMLMRLSGLCLVND